VIVTFGVTRLFDRASFWSGMWLVTAGAWLQIARLKIFGLTYGTSWPLLLIALGAGMIVKTLLESALPRETDDAP
jgi:hypothetical protein